MTTQETAEDIQQVWRETWQEYPADERMLFGHRLFVEGYKAFQKYIPTKPSSFLEIGAGSGRYGIALARDMPQSSVMLSDYLDTSLVFMKSMVKTMGLTNVSFAKEDALSLTCPSDSYDVVLADAVIQHILEPERAVREMVRVTKPGGRIIVSAVNTQNPFHLLYKKFLAYKGQEYEYGYERTYTRKELRTILEHAGVEVIAEDGFFLAYGLTRLDRYAKVARPLSRVLNRVVKGIDRVTARYLTRRYGFEIFCVGVKTNTH